MKNNPYYMSIFNHIVHQIYTGELSVGDSLDSVKVMGDRYAAGANTIHAVVKKLVEAGFVATCRGKAPVVISDTGNAELALSRLCAQRESISEIHEVYSLFFPPMAVLSVQKFQAEDFDRLDAILDDMEGAIGDRFLFRRQKALWTHKMISKSGSGIIREITTYFEESVMLPRMLSDDLRETENRLAEQRGQFVRRAKAVNEDARAGRLGPMKEKLTGLYRWSREVIGGMILEIAHAHASPDGVENAPESSFYLYERIVSDVIDQIFNGRFSVGDCLPPIAAMTQTYQVSMPTIRSAYKTLGELGLTRTVNGKGTQIILYSELPSDYCKTLDGMLRSSQFQEALYLVANTVREVACFSAERMTAVQIQEMEQLLRGLWSEQPRVQSFPPFALLGKIVECAGNSMLDSVYVGLKKALVWGIYLDRRFSADPFACYQKCYLCCLQALEALKCGQLERFGEIVASIFQDSLSLFLSKMRKLGCG